MLVEGRKGKGHGVARAEMKDVALEAGILGETFGPIVRVKEMLELEGLGKMDGRGGDVPSSMRTRLR